MTSRLLPDWLEAYMAYTIQSESPDQYHIWTALSTISGVMRRRVFFNMDYFLLYPNLYVVLVGPAGRCKKSTAMRIGRGLLEQIPGMEFTTDSVTRERLIQDLAQSFKDGRSAMTAYSSEFASLLTSSGMDMVVFLTDIFDCPNEWSHKTKIGGVNTIKAPYLNLFAATTPDWMAKAMPLDTVGIGLTSRVIFVNAHKPRIRPSRPKLTPEQQALKDILVKDLHQIATIAGEYVFDGEADEIYEKWYQGRIENPNPTGDPRLNGYFERKPMHLIKVCMLLSACKRSERVMTAADLERAMNMLESAEKEMPSAFAGVGRNPLAFSLQGVMQLIVDSGENGILKSKIIQSFSHDVRKEELDEVLATAVDMKIGIEVHAEPTGGYRYFFKG